MYQTVNNIADDKRWRHARGEWTGVKGGHYDVAKLTRGIKKIKQGKAMKPDRLYIDLIKIKGRDLRRTIYNTNLEKKIKPSEWRVEALLWAALQNWGYTEQLVIQ